MKYKVKFVTSELENKFDSMSNKDPRKKSIKRAIKVLQKDYKAGEYISKEDIPNSYIRKFGINNLRIYDLSGGFRLAYTLDNGDITITSVILEWRSHKDYLKLFNSQ